VPSKADRSDRRCRRHQPAAEAYRVFYARVDFEKNPEVYTIDHSAFVYLMDRDGEYMGFFPPGSSAYHIVDMIRPHLIDASRRPASKSFGGRDDAN
jgi:hypothetical protein